MRQDWSEGNGQFNRYQHIFIDFYNIIQLAWYINWIIEGDAAVKMSAERLKTT